MTSRDYVVWDHLDEGNSCLLLPPAGLDRDWELYKGIGVTARWPPGITARMSDDHPRNLGLTDNLMNLGGHIIASERLTSFLRTKALKNVEYLPLTIINHKGRIASRGYSLVHPTQPVDCLDLNGSQPVYSSIIPGDIADVQRLVLDLARIDADVALFRLEHFGLPIIVRRDLAAAIMAEGFRGVLFIELEEYGL